MPDSQSPRARFGPWRIRFGLRTLLLGAPLLGALAGTLGIEWYRDWRQREAVATLEAAKAGISRDARQQVVGVQLSGPTITDAELRRLLTHLIHLRSLKELTLANTRITDTGLMDLTSLGQLEKLTIYDSLATESGLARLGAARPGLEIRKTRPNPFATGLAMRPVYNDAVVTVKFSPDGKMLASGSGDGRLRTWKLDRKSSFSQSVELDVVAAHEDWLFTLAYRSDGAMLATGGGDNLIRLWDVSTQTLLGELIGHEDDVHAIAFSPDGESLYSTGDDGAVRAWDVASRQQRWEREGHNHTIPALAIDPAGEMLASGSRDDEIRLWRASNGEPLAVLKGHEGDVMALAFSPDGRSVLSASYDKTVRIWDIARQRTTCVLRGHEDWVFAAAWSPDGGTLASGGGDGLRLWDAASGRLLFHTSRQQNVSHLAFRPDGLMLASSSARGDVRLWNVPGRFEKLTLWPSRDETFVARDGVAVRN